MQKKIKTDEKFIIKIDDIEGSLQDNVGFVCVKDIRYKPTLTQIHFIRKSSQYGKLLDDGHIEIELDFVGIRENEDINLLSFFNYSGFIYFNKKPSIIRILDNNFVATKEIFDIKVSEFCELSYIQFVCVGRKVKYLSSTFKKNEIINVFINESLDPPMISVYPSVDQTFVPLMKGQIMQLFVDKDSEIDFPQRLSPNDLSEEEIKILDKKYSTYYYKSVSSDISELFFIKSNGKYKSVIIPHEYFSNVPILLAPRGCSVLYGYNIEGFIIRSLFNEAEIKISCDCPCRLLYDSFNGDFHDIYVEVLEKRPLFYLIKQEWGWLLSTEIKNENEKEI